MSYKLLLTQDVDSLGRKGEIVKTRRGYARNFLLPKKKAVIADAHTIRMQAKLKADREKEAIVDRQESESIALKLAEVSLTIPVKVDQEGHMYGSVSAVNLSHELKEKSGIDLDKRSFGIKHPLKQTGVHSVPVRLKEGVLATLTVSIEPIGSEEQKA